MSDKPWYYDAAHPDAIPDALLSVLQAHNLSREEIRLCFPGDLSPAMQHCETYLLATTDMLYIVSGSMTLYHARHTYKPTRKFEECAWASYRLADFTGFSIEEQISTVRLTGKQKDDTGYTLLAVTTLAFRDAFQSGAKYLGQLAEKGQIEADTKEHGHSDAFCPHCGTRYIDPARKICPKCMDKRKLLRRLGSMILQYKTRIILVVLALFLSSALGVLTPYISSQFYYDDVLTKGGAFYGQIGLVLAIIIGTRLLSMAVSVLHGCITSRISAYLVYDLKKTIFSSIERLSIRFFTSRQTGGLMAQVNSDANTIYWFFTDGVPFILVNGVQTIVVFFLMLYKNPLLTLIGMILIPLICICTRILFQKMNTLQARRWTKLRSMNAVLNDVLSGVRVVKAFSKEKDEIHRFGNSSTEVAAAERQTSSFSAVAWPFLSLLFSLSNLAVLGFGGWMVIRGDITYGALLFFIAYMNMVYAPLSFFADMIYWFTDVMNATSRLVEILDAEPDVQESEHPVPLPEMRGDIVFSHVDFSYEKNRKVIDDISFSVEAGHALGIVGHTGAGKSTLANLLIRLYDVTAGSISIDGVDIRSLSFADLRRQVAIVSQETYLFMGTILDNIRYARPEATYEEVLEAAKIAGAHDFIIQLPDAYATMIGFGYKDLSGGERQRLSIARAILRDPRILILDEATAAMDTQTERKIQNAIEQLSRGRTTITIAHRLSTLRNADRLIVIENGKIPEEGTHRELIEKKGIYYKLYTLQLEAMKNIGVEG